MAVRAETQTSPKETVKEPKPPKSPQEVLDRVGALISLAQSNPDDEEARTAAMQATRMMKEHELVLVPKSEIERVKRVIGEAQTLARQTTEGANQKMLLGALAGFFIGGGGGLLGKKGLL
jgi:hypothetical protein